MKSLILVVVTAGLAVGSLIIGWRLGCHQREDVRAYAVPLIDARLADAASQALILHFMDLGKYAEARAVVQGRFNHRILEVSSYDSDGDARRMDAARRACEMMVAFRNAYPSNYMAHPGWGDAWMVNQINAYLQRITQPANAPGIPDGNQNHK